LNLYLRLRHGSSRRPSATLAAVSDDDQGIRDRLSRQGEEALGRIAEELAGNPLVVGALQRAFEAREKASQAQEAAMGALGIPSAADIERLTRRLRSVSQRLEGIEDGVDRLDERLASIDERLGKATAKAGRAKKGESESDPRLEEIARDLAALRAAVAPADEPPPRAQERLTVTES
jgi:chromosome segregation ATPase